MKLHVRGHEVGPKHPRVRLWTDEMQPYGQFNVVNYSEAQAFIDMGQKLGLLEVVIHRCDGMGECDCHQLSYGEQMEQHL